MMSSLKFFLTPFILSTVFIYVILNNTSLWLGFFVTFGIVLVGDLLFGSESNSEETAAPNLLNVSLHLALPLLTASQIYFANRIGNTQSRDLYTTINLLGGSFLIGLIVSGYGTIVAHELCHRVHNKKELLIGRWLMAMSLNADFSIEHVYGHHVHIGKHHDPATGRFGENVYAFFLRSTIEGHKSAWRIESNRLKKKNLAQYSRHNKMLTGYVMSLAWIALYFFFAGPVGVIFFLISALLAKFLFEIVNYIQHYGLTREDGESVQSHHSWNANSFMNNSILYSLNRHSAHHNKGMLAFWKLKHIDESPMLPQGYFSSIVLALIPNLWFKRMDPAVNAWRIQYLSK